MTQRALRVTGRLLVAPSLLQNAMLRVGIERELARAEWTQRVHCLVAIVPLEPVALALAPTPKHLHIVIEIM